MREYETIYLLKPDLPGDVAKGLQDRLTEIIKKQEGHVLVQTDWGKRKLAYQIQKFRHAQYQYLLFLDRGNAISEMERILKYDDRVLRFLTVKLKDKVDIAQRTAKPVEAPPPPDEVFSREPEEPRGRGPAPRGRHPDEGEADFGPERSLEENV